MYTLVTGTFQAEHQAVQAVRKLIKACIPMDLVRTEFPGTRKRHDARSSNTGPETRERVGIQVTVGASQYVAQRLAIKILRDHDAQHIKCVNAERRAKPRLRVRVSARNQHAPVAA